MQYRQKLIEIIEASVEDLFSICEQSLDEKNIRLYAKILYAYLQADLSSLREYAAGLLGTSPEPDVNLRYLCLLRLQVRENKVNPEFVGEVEEFSGTVTDEIWRGEFHFVLALAFGVMKDSESMLRHSKEAAKYFEKGGALKKSVKAQHNAVAAETRIYRDRQFIPQYFFVAKRALRVKAHDVAASCYENVAREYQRLGALTAALRCSHRALALSSRSLGGYNYYLALASHCEILIDLGRTQEAQLDLELLSAANFPEIQASAAVLNARLKNTPEITDKPKHLVPAWESRWNDFKSDKRNKKIGALEEKIIECLSTGPMDKFALIQRLYPQSNDFLAAENRMKNLLNRLRKKFPGLIVFKDGKYVLAEGGNVLLPKNVG